MAIEPALPHPAGPEAPRPAAGSSHPPWWRLLAVFGAIAAVTAAGTLYLGHRRLAQAVALAAKPRPGISVNVATARSGSIGVYLDSIGTVTPVYTASISSQVTGQVLAVHYREGQLVQRGDPLVDIDPRLYRATLLQAKGMLAKDEGVLAQAKMDLERYRTAAARNAIAKQILEDQEKLVLQTRGTVLNDQGTVQYDQIQVQFCHVIAPISGRVGLRLVDPGNVVQAGSAVALAVITQLTPTTVVFTISEDNLASVVARLHDGAKLKVGAFDRTARKQIAGGTLLAIDNQIDTTTGTVKARALFANPGDALFPNEFVNTRLEVTTLTDVTLVPSSAVQRNGQNSFVYVIADRVAHLTAVQTGVIEAGQTQVTGIVPGTVVANSSFDKLQDKATVVLAATAAGAAVPATP